MTDRGDERIGDVERQRVIDLLRGHTGAGRLTLDEFSDLAGDVFAAKTRADLEKVLDGLPPGVEARPAPADAPAYPTATAPAPTAVPPARRRARRWVVAIMSGSTTRGRWQAPPEVTAVAFWGGAKVDLRGAIIETPVIDVYAWAIMGGVEVVVPDGVPVELDGMVVMGGSTDRTRATSPLPGAPLIRVHARGLWGGVDVRNGKRSRRNRGQLHSHSHSHGHSGDTDDVLDERADSQWPFRTPSLPVPPVPDWPVPPPMPNIPVWRHGSSRDDRRAARRGNRSDRRDRDDGSGRTNGSRVDGQAPAADAAAGPRGTLTMMVTDIVGSTRQAEELGDRRWMEVLRAHNAIVRAAVAEHGGTEVKAQGDGFLVVFSSARSAILAAVDVQRRLVAHRVERPDQAIDLRIGLHTGEIVDVDGDVFGQNVIVAVRIADHAGPGEILVSGLTRDLTQAGGDLDFDPGRELDLKGLSSPWRVHRVTWTAAPA
jgi:class 3 adenylate cyclase